MELSDFSSSISKMIMDAQETARAERQRRAVSDYAQAVRDAVTDLSGLKKALKSGGEEIVADGVMKIETIIQLGRYSRRVRLNRQLGFYEGQQGVSHMLGKSTHLLHIHGAAMAKAS